ncbi:OmpA family protein [Chitinophaga sp. Mgbs1]|uniref:OmpA family protein n=1 Tax=Chitinophaga solisilvae TaxID=1233460 RepID=A0A433WE04_9BACT|nr:OmpA family protein [Chitinophaga solisilvae]
MRTQITEHMRKNYLNSLILFLSVMFITGSCSVVKVGAGGMAKVNRAERLFKRQEYEKAISLCNDVLNNGNDEASRRKAKFQLARIYFETRQFEKTISLYDEVLYKPADDILVTDVTNYIDLLKRTGRVGKAKEVSELYARNYKNNARFNNLQQSLVNYYTFFNHDSVRDIRVDSLRLNLPGYQYGLALYKENVVFLSNDFKKSAAQSFYTNSKLYMISEDGVEPFNSSLRGVLQVGPASFFDNGQKVIYTSNRYTDIKNEKNSFINYNNGTQLLSSVFQPDHDTWSKPVPVKLGKSENYSFLHPSVASNGKRLYFASDMPGGQGGTDIYYADWDKTEKRWKAPVNMGPAVNTNGNELYPFVVGDKLFFSSNGLQGFGGLDIFMVNVKQPEERAAHLPYPVNTQFDDLNPVLDEGKLLLYFTSDRSGVHDNDHIYVLNLKKNPLKQLDLPYPGKSAKDEDKVPYTMNPAEARQQQTLVGDTRYDHLPVETKPAPAPVVAAAPVRVAVSVKEERHVIDYAQKNIDTEPEVIQWQGSGPARAALPVTPVAATAAVIPASTKVIAAAPDRHSWQQGGNTAAPAGTGKAAPVKAQQPVVTVPDTRRTDSLQASVVHVNAYTAQSDSALIAASAGWKIPGAVYFDLNSYVPKDQEYKKLDSIFYLWKANPRRIIQVNGHADVIGTEKYNLTLSKNRAAYIQECLLSRGVDADKIRINYFGSTRPVLAISQYTLDADREKYILQQGINRRCEIRIQ